MFYYIYVITTDKSVNLVKKIVIGFNSIVYLLAVFLNVTIINENGNCAIVKYKYENQDMKKIF